MVIMIISTYHHGDHWITKVDIHLFSRTDLRITFSQNIGPKAAWLLTCYVGLLGKGDKVFRFMNTIQKWLQILDAEEEGI